MVSASCSEREKGKAMQQVRDELWWCLGCIYMQVRERERERYKVRTPLAHFYMRFYLNLHKWFFFSLLVHMDDGSQQL